MPYRLEVFKRLGSETWENTYRLDADSDAEAITFCENLADAERTFHSDQVFFTYCRLSVLPPVPNTFFIIEVNAFGIEPGGNTGQLLPLWNVVKAFYQPPSGRPDFKLYRGCLGEANSGDGLVASGLRGLIEGAMDDFISIVDTPAFLTDGDDQPFNDVQCDVFIRERQLHRRKRRTGTSTLSIPS
jgi:hypothetical protein